MGIWKLKLKGNLENQVLVNNGSECSNGWDCEKKRNQGKGSKAIEKEIVASEIENEI